MARARRRRRNSEQGNLLAWTGGLGSHGQAAVQRMSAARAPSSGEARPTFSQAAYAGGAGTVPVHKRGKKKGQAKIPKTRRQRARRASDIKTKKKIWVDAAGHVISGDRWKLYHRGGLTLGGKRAKVKPAPRRKRKGRKGGSGRKKGRTAAQRAATRRMIAANKRRGGSRRARRMPARGLMQAVIGKMARGRVTFRVKGRGKSRGYTVRSRGRGRTPTRKQMRAALARMPKGRVTIQVRGTKKRRGFTLRNPRGGIYMARRNPRRRRRRNPGMDLVGTAKRTIAAAIPAVAGGAIISLIDAKLLSDRPMAIRICGKIVAAAAAGVLLRSRPQTAQILMGAMLGSLGYELGTKLSGGLLTSTKAQTVQALGTLVREDPQAMAALIDSTGAYTNNTPAMAGFDVNLG